MSNISGIGNSSPVSSQFLKQAPAPQAVQQTTVASALQEATESVTVTEQEAAKGDQVAIRKLASRQEAQKARHAPQAHKQREAKESDASATASAEATAKAEGSAGAGLDTQA